MFNFKIKLILILFNILISNMPYSKDIIQMYLNSLTNIEKIALKIAEEDLDTSFNIEKSIGFLNWLKKNKV